MSQGDDKEPTADFVSAFFAFAILLVCYTNTGSGRVRESATPYVESLEASSVDTTPGGDVCTKHPQSKFDTTTTNSDECVPLSSYFEAAYNFVMPRKTKGGGGCANDLTMYNQFDKAKNVNICRAMHAKRTSDFGCAHAPHINFDKNGDVEESGYTACTHNCGSRVFVRPVRFEASLGGKYQAVFEPLVQGNGNAQRPVPKETLFLTALDATQSASVFADVHDNEVLLPFFPHDMIGRDLFKSKVGSTSFLRKLAKGEGMTEGIAHEEAIGDAILDSFSQKEYALRIQQTGRLRSTDSGMAYAELALALGYVADGKVTYKNLHVVTDHEALDFPKALYEALQHADDSNPQAAPLHAGDDLPKDATRMYPLNADCAHGLCTPLCCIPNALRQAEDGKTHAGDGVGQLSFPSALRDGAEKGYRLSTASLRLVKGVGVVLRLLLQHNPKYDFESWKAAMKNGKDPPLPADHVQDHVLFDIRKPESNAAAHFRSFFVQHLLSQSNGLDVLSVFSELFNNTAKLEISPYATLNVYVDGVQDPVFVLSPYTKAALAGDDAKSKAKTKTQTPGDAAATNDGPSSADADLLPEGLTADYAMYTTHQPQASNDFWGSDACVEMLKSDGLESPDDDAPAGDNNAIADDSDDKADANDSDDKADANDSDDKADANDSDDKADENDSDDKVDADGSDKKALSYSIIAKAAKHQYKLIKDKAGGKNSVDEDAVYPDIMLPVKTQVRVSYGVSHYANPKDSCCISAAVTREELAMQESSSHTSSTTGALTADNVLNIAQKAYELCGVPFTADGDPTAALKTVLKHRKSCSEMQMYDPTLYGLTRGDVVKNYASDVVIINAKNVPPKEVLSSAHRQARIKEVTESINESKAILKKHKNAQGSALLWKEHFAATLVVSTTAGDGGESSSSTIRHCGQTLHKSNFASVAVSVKADGLLFGSAADLSLLAGAADQRTMAVREHRDDRTKDANVMLFGACGKKNAMPAKDNSKDVQEETKGFLSLLASKWKTDPCGLGRVDESPTHSQDRADGVIVYNAGGYMGSLEETENLDSASEKTDVSTDVGVSSHNDVSKTTEHNDVSETTEQAELDDGEKQLATAGNVTFYVFVALIVAVLGTKYYPYFASPKNETQVQPVNSLVSTGEKGDATSTARRSLQFTKYSAS